jgi:LmbE family N-acetylglucosaminyl deacetylase
LEHVHVTSANEQRPRILGVFAHPDDEIFCAGGTLAKYAAAGAHTAVVSATRGEAGQIRDARAATRHTLGKVREHELHQACALLGVTQARCLDYRDGTLQTVDTTRLVDDIVSVIDGFRPDAVITFGADGAYGHPDHVAISAAVTAACRNIAQELRDSGTGGHVRAAPRLYYSVFPPARLLLSEWLARELVAGNGDTRTYPALAHTLALIAGDLATMRLTDDYAQVRWFPPDVPVVQAGEEGGVLYLILTGEVDVMEEDERGTQHEIGRRGPGYLFSGSAAACSKNHATHVVTAGQVTCLVLSPEPPERLAGRAVAASSPTGPHDDCRAWNLENDALTCVDVSPFVYTKAAALAAHRTQYPIEPSIFPPALLCDLFGQEYFVRAGQSGGVPYGEE